MRKGRIPPLLIYCIASTFAACGVSIAGDGEWRAYSEEADGDVYFYDASRVQRTRRTHTVWQRIQYKRSVMGASSYQSRLEVDCSEHTVKILQRTFFSDKHWQNPAMNTDMKEKPKRSIVAGSAVERLSEILCDP